MASLYIFGMITTPAQIDEGLAFFHRAHSAWPEAIVMSSRQLAFLDRVAEREVDDSVDAPPTYGGIPIVLREAH